MASAFPKLRTPKEWLDKCLKSRFSENPFAGSMVNASKRYFNLNDSAFTIPIDRGESTSVGKYLP